MSMERLVLEDKDGNVVRAYDWDGEPVQVIRRGDTRRMELVGSVESLHVKQIPYELIGSFSQEQLQSQPFAIGDVAHLRLLPKLDKLASDGHQQEESSRVWRAILSVILFATAGLFVHLYNRPQMAPSTEEALKQEVIKIVKKIPARQKVTSANVTHSDNQAKPQKDAPKSPDRLKRMGALAALGSLSKSKQVGGLNLGAANTTVGPGLGGNAGSGGTQTSLYAKGLTSAPLGSGGKVEGAGGYGTKGKGGGQAGYGQLSLVGSTGAGPIGLAQEASVDSGLDRDAIAAVINRNLGQVRFCYEQGLQSDPNLSGRVSVDFVIGGNGMVKSAAVGNTTLNSKLIEDCILLRMKSWKFPFPQGGVDVKVSYPFVLRRTGQG